MPKDLIKYLNTAADRFNSPAFIEKDPISIPHRFSKLQDIEISGFWVAMLAWGQRVTIINKANELMAMMDNAPHDFNGITEIMIVWKMLLQGIFCRKTRIQKRR